MMTLSETNVITAITSFISVLEGRVLGSLLSKRERIDFLLIEEKAFADIGSPICRQFNRKCGKQGILAFAV